MPNAVSKNIALLRRYRGEGKSPALLGEFRRQRCRRRRLAAYRNAHSSLIVILTDAHCSVEKRERARRKQVNFNAGSQSLGRSGGLEGRVRCWPYFLHATSLQSATVFSAVLDRSCRSAANSPS